MKNLKIIVAGIALFSSAVLPAFAETTLGVGATTSASIGAGGIQVRGEAGAQARTDIINRAKDRADQEITRRIEALNKLNARVRDMERLSDTDKSGLSATIQSQITLMQSLQTKISNDADAESTSSLKADIQSITKAYRIYMLIIPQGAIQAAADRILNVTDAMTTLSGKLQTRISDAQTAGNDTSAAASALADMNAKIADAKVQVNAAVSETASLQPDNGDQTVMQANVKAMQDARTKIHAAQQDLVTARQDAGTIVKALRSWNVSAHATSTVSATTSSE